MENGKNQVYPYTLIECQASTTYLGLTKREHFAGLAMQGYCSNPKWSEGLTPDDWDKYKERLISGSIELADELLKQLEK